MSTFGGYLEYIGGYYDSCEGYHGCIRGWSVHRRDIMSTFGDIIKFMGGGGGYYEYIGRCSLRREIS